MNDCVRGRVDWALTFEVEEYRDLGADGYRVRARLNVPVREGIRPPIVVEKVAGAGRTAEAAADDAFRRALERAAELMAFWSRESAQMSRDLPAPELSRERALAALHDLTAEGIFDLTDEQVRKAAGPELEREAEQVRDILRAGIRKAREKQPRRPRAPRGVSAAADPHETATGVNLAQKPAPVEDGPVDPVGAPAGPDDDPPLSAPEGADRKPRNFGAWKHLDKATALRVLDLWQKVAKLPKWSEADLRSYLLLHYGHESRKELTAAEAADFLHFLADTLNQALGGRGRDIDA